MRACIGLALGGGIWLCLALLGVPNVFHMARMTGLVPSAAVGALMAVTRLRRMLVILSSAVFVFLLVIAYTPLIAGPARRFVRADPLPTSADAVVVLSAGVTPDGFLHQQGLDRLLKGLALVRHQVAPILLVTREERDVQDKKVTAAADQDSLAALAGITNIMSTPLEASTHDEALAVAGGMTDRAVPNPSRRAAVPIAGLDLQEGKRIPGRQVVAWAFWDWGGASFNAVITTFVFTVYLTSTLFIDPALNAAAGAEADASGPARSSCGGSSRVRRSCARSPRSRSPGRG